MTSMAERSEERKGAELVWGCEGRQGSETQRLNQWDIDTPDRLSVSSEPLEGGRWWQCGRARWPHGGSQTSSRKNMVK